MPNLYTVCKCASVQTYIYLHTLHSGCASVQNIIICTFARGVQKGCAKYPSLKREGIYFCTLPLCFALLSVQVARFAHLKILQGIFCLSRKSKVVRHCSGNL